MPVICIGQSGGYVGLLDISLPTPPIRSSQAVAEAYRNCALEVWQMNTNQLFEPSNQFKPIQNFIQLVAESRKSATLGWTRRSIGPLLTQM